MLSRCRCDPRAAPRHRTAGTQGGSAHIPSSEVGSWCAGGFQTSPDPDAPPPGPVEQQGEPFSTSQPQCQLEGQRTDHAVLQYQWSLASWPFHAFHNTTRQLPQPLLAQLCSDATFSLFSLKIIFFKLLLAACLDFTKDRSTSVSRLRMTQMHMSKGVGQDGLQRSLSRPVIYCWRRMPGEGLPKTECLHLCRKTSSGLSSYLPVRLEKEGWSSLFSFSLAHNLSTFKFPPCTQLPEGFGHPHFCWAWLTWMESYVCS